MSRVYKNDFNQNAERLLKSKKQIEAFLLKKITHNKNQLIGTEIELFVTNQDNAPLNFNEIEMILSEMADEFERHYPLKRIVEKGRMVGIDIPDLGIVCLEPGGQIELSTKPCQSLFELEAINQTMRNCLDQVAQKYAYIVRGFGHNPLFMAAQDVPRSRFHAYYQYCFDQHGKPAQDLIETMKSTAGLQINIDSNGEKFYQVYKAMMLLELFKALTQPTVRQKRFETTYTSLFPEQTTPLFKAINAQSNADIIALIADRLLALKVPFLPDRESTDGFISTKEIIGHHPSIKELMKRDCLTYELLDNCLSLQLMPPNIRRHGVLETRIADSVTTISDIMQEAEQYYKAAYNDDFRIKLNKLADQICPEQLANIYQKRFMLTYNEMMQQELGKGFTVLDLHNGLKSHNLKPCKKKQYKI